MALQNFHSLISQLNTPALDNVGRSVPGSARAWLDDATAYQATKVRSVGIVGAGVMGAAIAAAHIRHGVRVVICDANDAVLAKIHDTVATLISDTPGASNFSPVHVRRLVQPTAELAGLARCDMIIESIAETLSTKQQLYAQLRPYLGPRTVVATNTSTIPIAQLASGMKNPGRFCGMHFFHPVARRPLVEVVCGPQTSESTVATVVAHVKAIHRQPIIADDGPGFVVNRLLFPFLAEALEMLREGVSVETIERTATDFGMAMGPLQLMDEIGLDTTLQAGWVLATAFPERILASPLLVTMVKSKQLGCKSGAGFFLYNDSHESSMHGPHFALHGQEASSPLNDVNPALVNPALPKRIAQWAVAPQGELPVPQTIADRLLLPMVLEAARILEEGKALGPAEIDHGSVLGLGFPAWRGGLLQWADTLGAAEIIARLHSLDANAVRYQPPAMLTELAEHGGTFYPGC